MNDTFCLYGDDFPALDREQEDYDSDWLADAEEHDMWLDSQERTSESLLEIMSEV